MNRSKWWLFVDVAAIVPLLGLLVLFGIALVPMYRIAANPAEAVAFVTEKWATQRGGESRFALGYTFVAASGGEYRGATSASREIYDRTVLGDRLDVQYASDAPENHRVTSDTRNPSFIVFEIGGAATVLLTVLSLAWVGVRGLRSDLRNVLTSRARG